MGPREFRNASRYFRAAGATSGRLAPRPKRTPSHGMGIVSPALTACLTLLAATATGCADGPLTPVAPCFTGETRSCVVPPCTGPGVQRCHEGEWGLCEGYQVPAEEMCNGRDDSCDGLVDNNPQDPEIGQPCGTDLGRCRKGTVRCFNGELICFGGIEPRQEECNGLDDDCDGIVDNNLPEQLCYTGLPETRGVGICHGGIQRCVAGRYVCEFEQTPMAFDCTNGLDNDCDGHIDHEDERDIDVVLFVDWSGSMIRTLGDVQGSLLQFVDILRESRRVRIATVAFPDERNDGQCALMQELVPPAEARRAIESLEIKRVGIEPPYLCLYEAATGAYGLGFRPQADVLFMLFTDEPNFNNNLTQEQVAAAMNQIGAVGHFYVDPLFQHHYRQIVELTRGTMGDLEGSDLAQRLLSHLLSHTCSM
jgi:hypothetical protein